jgi:hypothetical protein
VIENAELVERLADEVEQLVQEKRIDRVVAFDNILSRHGYRDRQAPMRESVMDLLMRRSMSRIPRDTSPTPPKQVVQPLAFGGRISRRSARPPAHNGFDFGQRAAGEEAAARREDFDQAS